MYEFAVSADSKAELYRDLQAALDALTDASVMRSPTWRMRRR
jgi:hypothetical protein